MMIVGKYYQDNNDFINTMKVSSRYQELVSMYHFNPISDPVLFENLETQHFYNKNDFSNKLPNKFRYLNWSEDYNFDLDIINKRPGFGPSVAEVYLKDDDVLNNLKNNGELFIHSNLYGRGNDFVSLLGSTIFGSIFRDDYRYNLTTYLIKLYLPDSIRLIKKQSISKVKNLKKIFFPNNK